MKTCCHSASSPSRVKNAPRLSGTKHQLPPDLTQEAAMMGVAVEQMLDLWWTELRQVKAHLRALFPHPSVAASAAAFLDGLLGPERRKTGWMRAEAAGDPGPWRQQAVLGRSHGDADALRDLVREDAIETLASPDAGLVIDETGFLKQGQSSCGVGRPDTGSAGQITHCQIGVLAADVSDKGCAFIDRPLDRPQDWTTKPERRPAAWGCGGFGPTARSGMRAGGCGRTGLAMTNPRRARTRSSRSP